MNCRTDLKAMAENGHTENGAAAEKRKAEDDTENGENGANGAKREKVKSNLYFLPDPGSFNSRYKYRIPLVCLGD